MNIDELKLILEALQHTTDGAKDLGVWWIALHYGEKVLGGLFAVVCIWGVAWGIYKVINAANGSSEPERRLQRLRDAMGVGTSGILTDSEYEQMREKIRDWMRGGNK